MGIYEEFFLGRQTDIMRVELVEFTHPNFSQVYRAVRNMTQGVQVMLPAPDNELAFFDFYPLKIKKSDFNGSMDNQIVISFGDVNNVIPKEMRNVIAANGFTVSPKVRYWVYRSDDFTQPIHGPLEYEITAIPYNKEGFNAVCTAPKINNNGTGEMYTLERFPTLRGLL